MVLDKVSRALLVKLFYQNNNNSAAALREYRRIKGIRRGPLSAVALKNMIRKFELTGDLGIAPGRGRRPVTPQIVEEVTVAMAENAGRNLRSSSSARAVSRQLNIPWSTVRKVLRTIVKWYPYKLHITHQLLPHDADIRIDFALTFLARVEVDDMWPWNILWSDEAHFTLTGAVNTHNCRIWGSSPPTNVHEVPLHSERVTAWCGFTANFLIGPFFFEELGPQGPMTCSVNGTRYCDLLRQHVIPALRERGALDSTVFMQDGAPPHIANVVTRLLRNTFGENRIISRSFQNAWPPRSPDLNPCDFWLWGYLKDRVYQRNTNTCWRLKMSIAREIANIPPEMLRASVEQSLVRFQAVLDANGNHIEHRL